MSGSFREVLVTIMVTGIDGQRRVRTADLLFRF